MHCGTNIAPTVSPARRSARSHTRRYRRSTPTPGSNRATSPRAEAPTTDRPTGERRYPPHPQQGSQGVPDVLQGTPFDSFLLPGIALLACNAVPPLVAIIGTLRRRPWATPAHVAVGVILMGWIVVQVALIGFGSWLPLQAFCFALGLLIAALGVRNRRDAQSGGERRAADERGALAVPRQR